MKEKLDQNRKSRKELTGSDGGLPRRHLIPHLVHHLRTRSDEPDPGIDDRLCEIRPLRQKPVSRMHGVHPVILADVYDLRNVQVRLNRWQTLAHQIRFVCLQPMDVGPILLRIDRHGLDAQFRAGPEDSDRYLAPVGHQDASDRLVFDFAAVFAIVVPFVFRSVAQAVSFRQEAN